MSKDLEANCDYRNGNVEIFHTPSETWVTLLETRNAIVFYEDKNGDTRRAKATSIGDVRFNKEGFEPAPIKTKEEEANPVEDMVEGLTTNTDYSDSGLEVNHIDKGWMPLVRTANKVIYYKEAGKIRRMTPKKFGGVRNPAEEPAPFEESVDSFLFSEAA